MDRGGAIGQAHRCPLCLGGRIHVAEVIEYSCIWSSLEALYSVSFSAEVVARNTPAQSTTLLHCDDCGLQHFYPSAPGDAGFYQQLTRATGVYVGDRWEFGVVAGLLNRDERVLDAGCGPGAFLRLIESRVAKVVGLDLNPNAVNELVSSGIEAHSQPLDRFAASHRREFDVVCAFHLLEHVSSPDVLMKPALDCLRPGGTLFVSVPNRERNARAPDEPLDCPPHHTSRWLPEQFGRLADTFGLELVALLYEEPAHSAANVIFLDRANQLLTPVVGAKVAHLCGRLARKVLLEERGYGWATRRGWFTRHGYYGHSMLAQLRVPGERQCDG